jgi:hypothetical protein
VITKDGFQIEWHDQVVTVSKSVKDGQSFDTELEIARGLLNFFTSGRGSTWGCDGVGYAIQKRIGMVRINKSGVGPRAYQTGCVTIKGRPSKQAAL